MTPDQLITFAAVAEHLNISHAAVALHLSQPAVSGQLRLLQDEFGEPLYQRDGRGIRLTPVGEQLAQYAKAQRDTFAQARAFRDAVRGLEAGTLRIGASTTPASYLLPYLIAAFQPRAPRVTIQTMSGNTADVVAALPSLDIAMIEGPPGEALPPGTAVHAWREDEIVAIVPAAHPLAAPEHASGVTLAALAAHPLVLREEGSAVRQLVERAFAQQSAPMRVAFEIAGVEAVKEAVRAGMGVGFVSAMSLRHDDAALVARSLAPAPLTRHFSILVPHGGAPSRVAAQFLEMSVAQAAG
ncbi:LysR family transcriptional regulator [Burkholderia pseudomultivorans]|uniref:HTH-type transcriptional activator CmpR n=1 Tax=Burkholderia pseudomultivorans TaxID=1207504 RepID=A0A132EE34_9BURK|nr:LysR family transcriptional regulator [Burkholderia pseudomultivorans]KWF26635.1 LysR family transcriptional regulator [Burkholderia pseudomultivorans]MDR8731045.1 HTH-type transcriptional activator CmpR [Burkholderia pseudomultivorans]MDR8738603.1 HTH-type transcriptional activator CmpR [Burkholderia pseudomultivorans]MDR8745016.1 HTH-type transcriptional activator CmpR [Burkholderia pseudomultivorans]MDR8757995.1 HTH-type transcriptional activator CmpR [Burkholderia pseudomultivorans]